MQRVINVIYHLFDFVTASTWQADRGEPPTNGSAGAFVMERRHVAHTCKLVGGGEEEKVVETQTQHLSLGNLWNSKGATLVSFFYQISTEN